MPKSELFHQGLEGLAADNFGPGREVNGPHCLPVTQMNLWALLWASSERWQILITKSSAYLVALEEGMGFEPTNRFNPINSLANCRLRPLGHPSSGSSCQIVARSVKSARHMQEGV